MTNVESCAAKTIQEIPHYDAVIQQDLKSEGKGLVKELYPDEAILSGLQTRDVVTIKYIYKRFYQPVRHMVTSNSGSEMDAEDVFQDALIVIYNKIKSGTLKLTSSFNTFLFAICRHIWLQKLNHVKTRYEYKAFVNVEVLEDISSIDAHQEENEKFKLFRKHFEKLSEDDQKMLKLFMDKVPLAEIARIMGYNSYDYAKVRKYLVKEKLKNSILNDPAYRQIVHDREMAFIFEN